MAFPTPQRVKLFLTPTIAIAAAGIVALACLFLPADVLEVLVLDSGIPAIVPAAEPPLGYTARVALAMTAGGAAGALAWLAAYVTIGLERSMEVTWPKLRRDPAVTVPGASPIGEVPVLRRADAHPDAPPRAPLIATRDLGAPFLDISAPNPTPPAERALPRDLDAPLSAYDPVAVPDSPVEPVPVVTPLQPRRIVPDLDPGERFDAFELPRPIPTQPQGGPIVAPRTDATIHALLDRLERGVSVRPAAGAKPASIADTLEELRALAAR